MDWQGIDVVLRQQLETETRNKVVDEYICVGVDVRLYVDHHALFIYIRVAQA